MKINPTYIKEKHVKDNIKKQHNCFFVILYYQKHVLRY